MTGPNTGIASKTAHRSGSLRPAAIGEVFVVENADSVDSSEGYVVSLRVLDYEGPETYCDGTGNCATRDVTLTTAPGFDSMTGLGSVGTRFISTLAKF